MIHLIATVDEHRLDWLPQFVAHYRALGVEQFLISLHLDIDRTGPEKRETSERATQILDSLGTSLCAVLCCRFRPSRVTAHHNRVRTSMCQEEDWVVWADIDEFQEYADPLPDTLSICEELGFREIRGKLIDRVSRNGSLAPFDPSRPIWQQYPVGANVTSRILGGWNIKVTASKAGLEVGVGHHFLVAAHTRVFPKEVTIHHFKWDAGVTARLRRRLSDDYRTHCEDWQESRRFFDHLETYGKIQLGLLQQRILAPPFSPAHPFPGIEPSRSPRPVGSRQANRVVAPRRRRRPGQGTPRGL